MKNVATPALIFVALGITGCAVEPIIEPAKPRDIFKEQMIEAADRASQSQRILAESRNAITLDTLSPAEKEQIAWQSSFVPPGMEKELRIDWQGPIMPILEVMAKHAGYKLHVNGRRPVTDLIVSVVPEKRQIVSIIRDIGTQLGVAGRIEVIPTYKVIELHYAAIPEGTVN